MRPIRRSDLPVRCQRYLERRRTGLRPEHDIQRAWKAARQTKIVKLIATELSRMVGRRSRCMYCGDSRGTDIDHHWPKSRYRDRTFLWENLLWTCSGCNRKKGEKFRLAQDGSPLLIDPTSQDPWDHLYFDSTTGNVVARYRLDGTPDPQGEYTSDPQVLPLNIQVILEGRLAVVRMLKMQVEYFLQGQCSLPELLKGVRDGDAYGLPHWFFLRDGQNEQPFCRLKLNWSEWQAVQHEIQSWTN